jgi:hypothetical protein
MFRSIDRVNRAMLLPIASAAAARIVYFVWLSPYELVADEAQCWDWSRRLSPSSAALLCIGMPAFQVSALPMTPDAPFVISSSHNTAGLLAFYVRNHPVGASASAVYLLLTTRT